jgi:hypothetical protein
MLARFSGLPHGLEFFEGNVHDQDPLLNDELTVLGPKGMPIVLVYSLDLKPPWGTLTEF